MLRPSAMILDLDQFIRRERPYWDELETLLKRQDDASEQRRMPLEEVRRLHYLYQRASSDLVKMKTFAGDVEARHFLENLVGRAYSQLHDRRGRGVPFRPGRWLFRVVPQTFRRHWKAFVIAIGTFWLGGAFGALFLHLDYDNKSWLIPAQFGHLNGKPSDRVEMEEKQEFDHFESRHTFSAQLQQNNIRVSIVAFCMGILFGVFTLIYMFYNGLIIGVVIYDYILDGQSVFLTAWLLPHGSFELLAIFIAGQAGLVVGHAVFGWGTNLRLRQRLARIRSDVLTLIGICALMLVWAGIVESFLSQYHSPGFYPIKIAFGVIEMILLIGYFGFCGYLQKRKPETETDPELLPSTVS
ncbi:MAG: stage II sporulation protein M [Verrucomicrobiales bacterium]|nr:stage II sporulation protein M [Verrucomicrobiales bacterium]